MDQIRASVLISSHDRAPLLLRTLHAIAERGPSVPFEVVLADDGSTDDIEGLLRQYASAFRWTLVRCDPKRFAAETGAAPFWNNPAWTNNVAFRHASPDADLVFTQGNEVIAWEGVYDALIAAVDDHVIAFSTTHDVPPDVLAVLDPHGANLDQRIVDHCGRWPLQSASYPSDVTNYLSLARRSTWERIGGYDERYLTGIGGEDSDFTRRARALGAGRTRVVPNVSLHQDHGGFNRWREAATTITPERRAEGEAIKWKIFNAWDGSPDNRQPWPRGSIGVVDVVKNH